MSTTVVNIYRAQSYDVCIMRPSKYGNPYIIGKDGTREEVIEKFKAWLLRSPQLIEMAKRELKGKKLGCCCKPLACHGDVWVDAAEGRLDNDKD